MIANDGVSGKPWTDFEVEAVVTVYFQMLRMQEMGQELNKAAHNRQLAMLIPARNIKAIEYKHRNISAVLNLMGVQSIRGYKAAQNFQSSLISAVANELRRDALFDEVGIRSVETPAEKPLLAEFSGFVVEAPRGRARRVRAGDNHLIRLPFKRDYLERESRNRSLGLAGELVVLDFESRRLHLEGAKHLCDRIEHSSVLKGDGLGYDVLSFDSDGRERFIEVKTTAYDAETPFFVSPNEVSFSEEQAKSFQTYRLFDFRRNARMFALQGAISSNFLLDPCTYRASLQP